MITKADLENWFVYHEPISEEQVAQYRRLRAAAYVFAEAILENTPTCPDQTTAIRKVREAAMTANAAIACGGR